MSSPPRAGDGPRESARRRASRVAGLCAAVIAITGFAGWWWAGLPAMANVGLVFAPPVALGVVVLGLALVHPGRDGRLAVAAGVAATALGIVLAPLADGAGIRNLTPIALVLAGAAMTLARFDRTSFAASALALGAGAIAVLGFLSALSGLDALYGAQRLQPPEMPVAVTFILIAYGVILRRGRLPRLANPRPLWQLLFALGCVIVAPLVLFGGYAGSRLAEAQLDQVRNDLRSQARAIATGIDRQVTGELEKLRALAASPSLPRGDFAAFRRQAEAGLADHRRGMIVLIDRDMDQIVNTRVAYGTPLPKSVIQGPVQRVFATGRPQFTGLFISSLADELVFAIVVPVTVDGETRYALASSPDRELFAGFVAAHELPPGWQVAVTDASHRIIALSRYPDGAVGTELPRPQWRTGPVSDGGTFEFVDAAGRRSLQAVAWSGLTGWETAVWGSESLLTAPVRALWRTLGWLALFAFGLVATLALWFGQQIAGSVTQAARAATALGAGLPLPPGRPRIAEVNALMAQLHEASARREAVEDLLRQSEETFRVMFDKSSVPKIEVVPVDGHFLRVNDAMCRFIGYSEAELLDLTVWDITHPDDLDRDRDLIDRLFSGEAAKFDVEKRYVRKDGTPVWAHTTVNIICDERTGAIRDFAVIEDIDARKRAEEDLKTSKDRFALALEAANLGAWQYDPVRRVLTGDARVREIHGVDPSRVDVPIAEVFERMHPDDAADVSRAIAAAIDPCNPQRTVIQYRLRCGRGEFRWIETLGQAHFEGTGAGRRAVNIVGTSQDVTERKEREEKEHLLMREINHRAKNMLSVVSAIASQTASRNPEDFVARFSERIQALSANQDLLVRNAWNGVEVEDLVRAQLAHFLDLVGTRITVHGPKLRLTAAAAQAIGLALHELATNAGKYGALSTDRGEVDVNWDVRPDGGGNSFTMNWAESGGPKVVPPQRRGFGSLVIDVLTRSSVAGRVDLDYAPTGVTWRLACPAENVLEPFERHDGGPGGDAKPFDRRNGGFHAGEFAEQDHPRSDRSGARDPARR